MNEGNLDIFTLHIQPRDEPLNALTSNALLAAVAPHDEAIRLLSTLDLSVPQFCSDLAGAHYNRGNALRDIGTPEALQAAIAAYDEAIRLRSTLDLSVPQFCNYLVQTHVNRGLALEAFGTLDALQASIAAYDEAIRLSSTLNLSVPQFCSDLANAHTNRGVALQNIGTLEALQAAVAAYDEVIRLRSTLDLSVPQFCNDLASAHMNRGNVLQAFGTLDALQASIAAYDEAIRLSSTLNLSVPQFCNGLANAHMNRGVALQNIGTLEALQAAVAACDEAIRLRSTLDLSVPQFCNDLASAHMNRGNVLQAFGTPEALQAAVTSYDEVIRLRSTLDLSVPQFCSGLATAYFNRSSVFSRANEWQAATEDCEEALLLLSSNVLVGYLQSQEMRERVFSALLAILIKQRDVRFIPEIVLEHLSPDSSNSVPTSFPMHRVALDALTQGEVLCAQDSKLMQFLPDYLQAHSALSAIRARYLAGTLEGVVLRAHDLEMRKDSTSAYQLLQRYCDANKRDPQGWMALAELLRRMNKPWEMQLAYIEASRRHVFALRTLGPDDLMERTKAIGHIARILFRLMLSNELSVAGSNARDSGLLATINRINQEGSRTWQHFRDEILSPPSDETDLPSETLLAWHQVLESELQREWQALTTEINQHRDEVLRQEGRDDVTARFQQVAEVMREQAQQWATLPTKNLGQNWSAFLQKLQFAWADVLDQMLESSTSNHGTLPADVPEKLKHDIEAALSRAFEKHTSSLVFEDEDPSGQVLEDWLGSGWQQHLTEAESKLLIAGIRLMRDPDCLRYAGLELGLAVEVSIRNHLLDPLKTHASNPEIIQASSGKGVVASALRYVRGNGFMMLGQLVEFLHLVVGHKGDASGVHPVIALTQGYLNQWPELSVLTVRLESEAGKNAIEEIKRMRNDCAHGHDAPDGERLKRMLAHVIGDEEFGFFRYWIRARLGVTSG